MKIEDLFEEDSTAGDIPTTKQSDTPQVGDLVIVSNKGGQFVAIIGQIDGATARIFDYASRRQMGAVILKYLNITPNKSKYSRKELSRRLGFQSNDASQASKYTYKDITRAEYKNKRY